MALTVVINDDFTDVDGTLLTAHTPTADGTGWTKLSGVNDSIKIISNGLECPFHNDAGYSWYTANVTEAATDAQRITTVVGAVNPRDFLTVGARLQSDTSSVKGYLLELNDGSNLVRLYRVDTGVLTQVGAASAIQVAVGSTIIWEITAAGVHTVKHNGSLVTWNSGGTTLTDNTHTGGKVGIAGKRTVEGAALDSFIGEYDAAAGTPATFNGTIPAQTFNDGDAVSVDLSSYFSGTATPFSYANTGTALTGTGLSINASTGFLEGTATTGSVTGVIVTATDADTATADSNTFNVTVNAAISGIRGDTLPVEGDDGKSVWFQGPSFLVNLPTDDANLFYIDSYTQGSNTTIQMEQDGSFVATAVGGYTGSDSFTFIYRKNDIEQPQETVDIEWLGTAGGITIPLSDRSTWQGVSEYLESQGFVGNVNDIIISWLESEGYPPTFNDSLRDYLGANGYSGSLSDKLSAWRKG